MNGLLFACVLATSGSGSEKVEPLGWMRPVWNEAGGQLEIAARAYEPVDGGPRVWLVGVIHIGEPAYYDAVESLLMDSDRTVFESVLPTGGLPPGGADDVERAEQTEVTADLLAGMLAGSQASDWNGAIASLAADGPRMVGIARTLDRDGWGRPWVLTRAEHGSTRQLVSFGADGSPGGEGVSADIMVEISATEPVPADGGLQRTMAESLGLVFQLDELPYGNMSWTPGDMSIDEVGAAFEARGERIEDLTDLLSEKGLVGGLVRGIFGMIPTLDALFGGRVVDTIRVVLIETLGNESAINGALTMQGPAFKEVLIDLRNERAMQITDSEIAANDELKSIAVLYGAGHLSGLAELLAERGDYTMVDERWLPAMHFNINDSPLSRGEVDLLRGFAGRMSQLGAR
jgi:hypothetical protein